MNTQSTSKKYLKGFTLVETLVAVSLISIAVAGTLTAIQEGLKDTTIAKDQIVAFYLAQEGMEFIKNKRDENALRSIAAGGTGFSWLTGMSATGGDPCFFGQLCRIDGNAGTIVNCSSDPGGTCIFLNQNTTNGLYGYTSGGSWVTSRFRRRILFQAVPGTSDEVTVLMIISWTDRGSTRSFQVTESFFNR